MLNLLRYVGRSVGDYLARLTYKEINIDIPEGFYRDGRPGAKIILEESPFGDDSSVPKEVLDAIRGLLSHDGLYDKFLNLAAEELETRKSLEKVAKNNESKQGGRAAS